MHNPETCIYCLNSRLVNPEDHTHTFDSAVGISCFLDPVAGSMLMLQCECGHTIEVPGILHPDPPPAPRNIFLDNPPRIPGEVRK